MVSNRGLRALCLLVFQYGSTVPSVLVTLVYSATISKILPEIAVSEVQQRRHRPSDKLDTLYIDFDDRIQNIELGGFGYKCCRYTLKVVI